MLLRSRLLLLAFLVFGCGLAFAPPAAADDDCSLATIEAAAGADPEEAVIGLVEAQLADCFGIDAEPPCATGAAADQICLEVHDWALRYQAPDPDFLDLCEQSAALTGGLAAVAATLPALADVVTLRRRLGDWRIDCQRLIGRSMAEHGAVDWEVDGELEAFSGADQIDARAAVAAACREDAAGAGTDDCVATTRTYFVLLHLIGLQHAINSRLLGENFEATVRYIADLDARWDAYFTRGRSLLPWEVAINGRLARPERGFNEPPRYQLVFLHPAPVVTTSGLGHDDMAAGIALDLVGIYAWRWEGTQMRAPFDLPGRLGDMPLGGALTLTIDGNDDPGLGLVAYLPRNWSLGAAVNRDGDLRLLLSVDLAKLVVDPQSQRQRLVQAFSAD